MPSGVGVVETFKNLIRHGKAHQGQKQDETDVDFISPEHQQQRQHRAVPPKEHVPPEAHRHHHEPKEHKKPADYAHEAEMIVQEERQAMNNIPQYKGLERYRILEKMGESVAPLTSWLIGVVLIHLSTAAVHSQMCTRLKTSPLDKKLLVLKDRYHHLLFLTIPHSQGRS